MFRVKGSQSVLVSMFRIYPRLGIELRLKSGTGNLLFFSRLFFKMATALKTSHRKRKILVIEAIPGGAAYPPYMP